MKAREGAGGGRFESQKTDPWAPPYVAPVMSDAGAWPEHESQRASGSLHVAVAVKVHDHVYVQVYVYDTRAY